ncbi:MAG TPA: type II toxin-antitoxin system HicA family toxin [Blastocatellia bacterium]|nr:type II toxin-antitoxin system HicA family toxin [Blastocatellia bacterium]
MNHDEDSGSQTDGCRCCSGEIGFHRSRQRGSHRQFRHPDGRCTTVPFHQGRDISPILLRQIARDIRLTPEEPIEQK